MKSAQHSTSLQALILGFRVRYRFHLWIQICRLSFTYVLEYIENGRCKSDIHCCIWHSWKVTLVHSKIYRIIGVLNVELWTWTFYFLFRKYENYVEYVHCEKKIIIFLHRNIYCEVVNIFSRKDKIIIRNVIKSST